MKTKEAVAEHVPSRFKTIELANIGLQMVLESVLADLFVKCSSKFEVSGYPCNEATLHCRMSPCSLVAIILTRRSRNTDPRVVAMEQPLFSEGFIVAWLMSVGHTRGSSLQTTFLGNEIGASHQQTNGD